MVFIAFFNAGVADLDLISVHFAPRESGDDIRVAGMPGRIGGYDSTCLTARSARPSV